MIRRHIDIRIPCIQFRNLRARQRTRVNLTRYLCRINITALLVQTTHGIEQVKQPFDFRIVFGSPVKANQSHTACGRNGAKDSFFVNDRRDVFKAQSRNIGIARNNKFRNCCLIPDRQICNSSRQMQFLNDTAVRQRQACNLCAIEIDFLNDTASRDIHSLLCVSLHGRIAKTNAVTDIDFLQQDVIAKGKRT